MSKQFVEILGKRGTSVRGVVTRDSLGRQTPHDFQGHLKSSHLQAVADGLPSKRKKPDRQAKRKAIQALGVQGGRTSSSSKITPRKKSSTPKAGPTPPTGASTFDVSSLELHEDDGRVAAGEAERQLGRLMESMATWRQEHVAKLAAHLATLMKGAG